MLPDGVSNPGPLTYESGALPIALRGPAGKELYNYGYRNGLKRALLPHWTRLRGSCIAAIAGYCTLFALKLMIDG